MEATAHISINSGVCGGKPCVAGTRIRVWDVHFWHDVREESPQEIVANFPQLSLDEVHAAIEYYRDHRETIEQQIKQDEALADQMRRAQGPTKLDRLKAERGLGDSFSF